MSNSRLKKLTRKLRLAMPEIARLAEKTNGKSWFYSTYAQQLEQAQKLDELLATEWFERRVLGKKVTIADPTQT